MNEKEFLKTITKDIETVLEMDGGAEPGGRGGKDINIKGMVITKYHRFRALKAYIEGRLTFLKDEEKEQK